MGKTRLCSSKELDIVKTFECGQCFRWNAQEDGSYIGTFAGMVARLEEIDGEVYITNSGRLDIDAWRDYFDLDLDYARASASFDGGEYLRLCAEFGAGIRILRQDKWEALCSFIISQCNNIPRIKKIVESLCELFGDEISFDGKIYYSFPSAARLAVLSPEDLAPLRSGYRAVYIIDAAKKVASGELDLENVARMETEKARAALMSINGVGAKVANCAVLFGLHHMHAFPVDVWIKRALSEHFPKGFDPAVLGDYAGLAQQYIFYYARSGGGKT